jgi:hypothetical protein
MFTIDEIKARINQSNVSAFSQRGTQAPYPKAMARLTGHLHHFCEVSEEAADIDGIWKPGGVPGGNRFNEDLADRYRGAFARTQTGERLRRGPRGRTAIYNLFQDQALKGSINRLLNMSWENSVHLMNFDWDNNSILEPCRDFWCQCENFEDSLDGSSISVIYRSKTLSMLFPDLFVPFDSGSIDKLREDNDAGKLARTIDWPRDRNIRWLQYLDAHKYFQQLCWRLKAQVADAEEDPVRYLRELSCYLENDTYQNRFDEIARDITDPPPITRFIDKIFYMPGQRENTNPPPDREDTPDIELANDMQHVISPLSGRGKPIGYNVTEEGLHIRYSGFDIILSQGEIDDVLDQFFIEPDQWYHSGASWTNPPPGSFGAFLNERDDALNSSKVTPISAVLVHQECLDARGHKPIELKRRNDN